MKSILLAALLSFLSFSSFAESGDDCPEGLSSAPSEICGCYVFEIGSAADNPQVSWYFNDDGPYITSHIADYCWGENGIYTVTAVYSSETCPQETYTTEVAVDCFGNDCEFNVEIDQQSCAEYDLFTTEQEIVDWYVNDVFQLTATEYDFNATNSGTYVICAVNEGCPTETNFCETFVITEDCFEPECPISISYEEHACNTFTFTEDYGTQVAWTINGEFNNYFHGMDFDPTEPGTYEICATYETEDCPLGVTACETLVISEDCFEDDCDFNIEINQQSCAGYSLFSTEQEQLDWYLDDVFQITGTGYNFYPNTPGTYEICVVNEGCPAETNICETFVITEDCFEDDCPLEVEYEQNDCGQGVYEVVEAPENASIWWIINGEWSENSSDVLEVDLEPGEYTICAFYETPDCPMGSEWCVEFFIDDCDQCTEVVSFIDASIDGPEWVEWTINDIYSQESIEDGVCQGDFWDCWFSTTCLPDGCYEFIVQSETVIDPVINFEAFIYSLSEEFELISETFSDYSVVWEFSIGDGCADPCPQEIWMSEGNNCGCYEFEIGSFIEGESVIWNFGNGVEIEGGHYIDYCFEENGEYIITAWYESSECEGMLYTLGEAIVNCDEECSEVYFVFVSFPVLGGSEYIEWTLADSEGFTLENGGCEYLDNAYCDWSTCLEDGCYQMDIYFSTPVTNDEAFFSAPFMNGEQLPYAGEVVWLDNQHISYSFGVNTDCANSISHQLEESINIFPNPASESINILVGESISGSSLLIFDAHGRSVLEPQTIGLNETLSVSSLSQGLYTAVITNENVQITRKIQIIR